jgi:hypothetical protein
MATLQNNMVFQFTWTMLTSDTSVWITNDLERDLEVDFTDAYIEVKNRKGNKVERMKASATGGTFTASKRWLDQSDSDVEVSWLKQQRNEWSIAYVTILSSQLVDRQADNTFEWDQTFEGNVILWTTDATKYGVKLKALTTTQRNALSSPPDWTIILNTTSWAIEAKVGWSFQWLGAWATTPNASDAVTGKVRLSDQTQTEEQTTTEWWDPLVPTNVTINPNNITSATPATGDKLSFSDVSDSNKLRSATLNSILTTKNFGDWSDWAIWAWALTITGSNNTYIIKQYTTFAPWANTVTITPTNCILHIKVQGDCNLTWTTFTFNGKWWTAWAAASWGSWATVNGGNWWTAIWTLVAIPWWAWWGNTQWVAPCYVVNYNTWAILAWCWSWGWGWQYDSDTTGSAWNWWAWWGCLILEVGWALTFSSTTMNFQWANGSAGTSQWGWGWGWWGTIYILYRWALSWSPTTNVAWGSAWAWANYAWGNGWHSLTTTGSNWATGTWWAWWAWNYYIKQI